MPRVLDALQQFRENSQYPGLSFTKAPAGANFGGASGEIYTIRATHRLRVVLTRESGRWVIQSFYTVDS